MQNSAWRNRNVVYPKQDISRLEEEWFLVVGPWQSYAPPQPFCLRLMIQFLISQLVQEKASSGMRYLFVL